MFEKCSKFDIYFKEYFCLYYDNMVTIEASAKISGYLFQFQRALYLLFSSGKSNPVVGIETEDDVVEVSLNSEGQLIIKLEQDKHTIDESKNLLQDSSKNLWHTLHIWLSSLSSLMEKHSEVKFSLVVNNDIPENTLANKLSKINSQKDIDECLELMKNIYKKSEIGKGNYNTIKDVMSYKESDLKYVLSNLEVKEKSGVEPDASIENKTIIFFNLPPDLHIQAEQIYHSLFGFLVNSAYRKWVKKEPFWIDKDVFSKLLLEEVIHRRSKRYLERDLFSTSYKEYLNENKDEHLFLKQLNALNLNSSFCDTALEFYWGFYAEKVRLQVEGEILPSEWEERDSNLYNRWKLILENEMMYEELSVEKNYKNILKETLHHSYCAPLGRNETSHIYFTVGNYHYLANNNKKDFFVFWHPNFNGNEVKNK